MFSSPTKEVARSWPLHDEPRDRYRESGGQYSALVEKKDDFYLGLRMIGEVQESQADQSVTHYGGELSVSALLTPGIFWADI